MNWNLTHITVDVCIKSLNQLIYLLSGKDNSVPLWLTDGLTLPARVGYWYP